MVQSVHKLFLLFFIIVLVYSSYSYAPAVPLWSGPLLDIPGPDVLKECWDWLLFHGLKLTDTLGETGNIARAMERTKSYDGQMHVLAGCYAYYLTGFDIFSNPLSLRYWSTERYCERFEQYNEERPFYSLESTTMTCAGWVHAFGYHKTNMNLNVDLAIHRRRECDNDPHLLVTMYSKYVEDIVTELAAHYPDSYTNYIYQAIRIPPVFCEAMENSIVQNEPRDGEHRPMFLPYATLDTRITCQEWIHLSGYSFNIDENIRKAFNQRDDIKPYLCKWTLEYINYIINEPSHVSLLNPVQFCTRNGLGNTVRVYYNRIS